MRWEPFFSAPEVCRTPLYCARYSRKSGPDQNSGEHYHSVIDRSWPVGRPGFVSTKNATETHGEAARDRPFQPRAPPRVLGSELGLDLGYRVRR